MIHRSPFPDVEIPTAPLTAYVFSDVEERAGRIAIVDGLSGRSYTSAELHGAIRKVAGGLVAAGMESGDVLAIVAPNLPEYAVLFHGVAMAGGTVTTINPTYTAGEIASQLEDSQAKFVVTITLFLEAVSAAARTSLVEHVYVLGEPVDGLPSFFDLLLADPIDQVAVDPAEHVVALPYSSGTTGLPKGVELTHRNLVANLAQGGPMSTAGAEDVVLAVLPFFHIYGLQVILNSSLHRGAKVVTLPRFDLAEFLQAIQDHRVTRVGLVPPIVLALAKHPMVDEYDLSSLIQIGSGAAPLGSDIEDMAAARTGAEVVQGYGLTETSPVTHAAIPGAAKSGSIGVLIPNTEARIVDPDSGDEVPVGQSGEVWIRGPQVMRGYLNNPAATDASIDEEGWLHTGDIGRVDEDRHWYITDRLKELIKYKGFQVAPAELETVLLTHPGIADAAVVSVPDEEAGEIPKAFVVLQPGVALTPDEVMAHVADRVAPYKKVRRVEFIDAIPKSLSGKILRRILKEREVD